MMQNLYHLMIFMLGLAPSIEQMMSLVQTKNKSLHTSKTVDIPIPKEKLT